MLMNQVKQLQNKVMQLSNQQHQGRGQPNNMYMGRPSGHQSNNMNQSYDNTDKAPKKFLSSSQNSSRHANTRPNNERPKAPIAPNGKRKILLVSNLPPVLANPDSVYFMFVKFGTVEKLKCEKFSTSLRILKPSNKKIS